MTLPSPTGPALARDEVFLTYLDYFRERIIEKVSSMPGDALVVSILPSDWTPLELVKHVTFVEMRWLEWGFEGQPVDEPWGDHLGERWVITSTDTLESLVRQLRARGITTAAIVRRHQLDEIGAPGPRWSGDDPATLERVLFHLLQEYARHVGHLDIYAELVEGQVGE